MTRRVQPTARRRVGAASGGALLLALACSLPAPAQALSASAATCRYILAGGARKVASLALARIASCHAKRVSGALASTVNCNQIDDAGFPASSRASIDSLAESQARNASSACAAETPAALGYDVCPSPCTTAVPALMTLADVSHCLSCLAETEASVAALATFGSSPDTQLAGTAAWSCQTRIAKAARRYAKTRMGWQRSCQKDEDRATIGTTDCAAADLGGKIAAARLRAVAAIARCTDAEVAALSSCSATVAGEEICAPHAAETLTDDLFAAIYRDPPATPTRTPTSTPTQTATATATPTGGACPAFLDVSGAAGPGGSYASLVPALSVSCTTSTVTVHSNGIPTYQYLALTPNGLQAKSYAFTFPRQPSVAASTTAVPLLGNVGVALNGIPIYGVNEGPQPASDAYGDPIAAAILDPCGSHSAQQGTFHYHKMLVKCLRQSAVSSSQPWNDGDPSPSEASPIIGYAFDGFPIYGPYECTDVGCSSVQQMLSSWDNTGYQTDTVGCGSSAACSNGYCTAVMINGVQSTACVPKTCVWSNNTFTAKVGSQYLDQCNGHTGPNGDYHYHTTDTFPYILGCYRGTPTNNGGSGTPPGGTCP